MQASRVVFMLVHPRGCLLRAEQAVLGSFGICGGFYPDDGSRLAETAI